MTPAFTVLTSPHFERLARAQLKRHREFATVIDRAITILQKDPYIKIEIKRLRNLLAPKLKGSGG